MPIISVRYTQLKYGIWNILQHSTFTIINSETYTNKWSILQKSRFPFGKTLHLLVLIMKHTLINGMEYFAKKTFSFLQDCALTSINNTSTNTSTRFCIY